ncbi:hypothetical protein BDW69DRAFT_188891 [Aspergillus filifer]
MSVYQRVQLARILASAILYYHATLWMSKRLCSTNIGFLGDPDILLQKAPQARSYIVTSVQTLQALSQSPPLELFQIVRNAVIFGLGIMFLELAYQVPLEDLQEPGDIKNGRSPEFVEYFAAHRLLRPTNRTVSKSLKNIITQCLNCDFGQGSDFTKLGL